MATKKQHTSNCVSFNFEYNAYCSETPSTVVISKSNYSNRSLYVTLGSFILSNYTFFSDELYIGLQDNNVLYPMIILGAIKRLEDLKQIEDTFQKDHKDMNMRDKVRVSTLT